MCIRDSKKAGSKLILVKINRDAYDLPDYEHAMGQYKRFHDDIQTGRIISAYAVDGNGMITAVSKMAFGNKIGVRLEHNVYPEDLFAPGFGSLVAEVPDGKLGELSVTYTVIGQVTGSDSLEYQDVSIPIEEALNNWTKTLEKVFPTKAHKDTSVLETPVYDAKTIHVCTHKLRCV